MSQDSDSELFCTWKKEIDPGEWNYWETSCGNSFIILEGTPTGDGMKYCCYCGKMLLEENKTKKRG